MGAFHAYDIRGIYNKDFDRKAANTLPEAEKAEAVEAPAEEAKVEA